MTTALLALVTLAPFALVAYMQRQDEKARYAENLKNDASHAWKVAYRNARQVRRLP